MNHQAERAPKSQHPFLERLAQGVLIGDGAMATVLHQGGIPIRTCYESLSVRDGGAIERVHAAYLQAGADWMQTNTFGAHRTGLSRYDLASEVAAINHAAVQVARAAIRSVRGEAGIDSAFVFGTIGSIIGARAGGGLSLQGVDRAELRAEYEEQIGALLGGGVDGLVLETFADADEMLFAIATARSMTALPIVANLSPETVGVTRDGVAIGEAFQAMRSEGADVVGLNCRLGPSAILRSYEALTLGADGYYAAVPNAGLLHVVEGDYSYTGSAAYFADTALQLAERGVRLLGGCCGTTPDHVRQMVARLQTMLQTPSPSSSISATPAGATATSVTSAGSPATSVAGRVAAQNDRRRRSGEGAPVFAKFSGIEWIRPNKSMLAHTEQDDADDAAQTAEGSPLLLAVRERTTVIVELDPPRTLDPTRFLRGAAALRAAGADFVTMADNSLGHVRVSNMALAALLKQGGIEPLVHVTCRDRNLIGQQSHLMGLDVLGIAHILLVTGDPTRFGDLPGATAVYDVSSIELTRMVKRLNAGVAFSGEPMRHPSKFVVGTSFNPNVIKFDKALERLHRKVEAGADFVMTQPVFDERSMERIALATINLGVPVFIGVMPLVSSRNAQFLHNEVPGIQIPEQILRRMADAPEATAAAEGLRVAASLLDCAGQYFNGIYLITPFLRYELTAQLTEYARGEREMELLS